MVGSIKFPNLPVVEQKQDILAALSNHQVIIVGGETGSGKSTQLAKLCLANGFIKKGIIGHTQPRRLAAVTLARRVASELNCELGEEVGYQVRFKQQLSNCSVIKFMTDGILLTEISLDKNLTKYDVIIIDEAHERSLNIDFILGVLKRTLKFRKDLKIIITSATIELQKFSEFFNNAPIINVKGRQYPVGIKYLPQALINQDIADNILEAIKLAIKESRGDILIFQTGEREIKETIDLIRKSGLFSEEKYNILALYARLNLAKQQQVFKPSAKRKIVIATNVAETSITVPNISCVIDCGLARTKRYNYKSKITRLPIEPISKASAMQRAGRAGRVQAGICYRLYSEEDFANFNEFTEPEILRSNLASVLLNLFAYKLGKIEKFLFLDKPEHKYIKDGLNLLTRLGAVKNDNLTKTGILMAKLPLEPKLAKIIIAANQYRILSEVLIIVSFLSIPDLRKQDKSSLPSQTIDKDSDFISILKLWVFITEQKKLLSHKKFRKFCDEYNISLVNVLEWFDILHQLKQVCIEQKFKLNSFSVNYNYPAIHTALLTGFIDTIGVKVEEKSKHRVEYLGPRNIKFLVHPQNYIKNTKPNWLMAAQIVTTSQNFAKYIAKIEPSWVIRAAQHLLKTNIYNPYFDLSAQKVLAFEQKSIFGLDLVINKKVDYALINLQDAREIFIRQALVDKNIDLKHDFIEFNQNQINNLLYLETKLRQANYFYYPDLEYQFYLDNLPEDIVSRDKLVEFLASKAKNSFKLKLDAICAHKIPDDFNKNYPDKLLLCNTNIKLEYCFDLNSNEDGVSFIIYKSDVQSLSKIDFNWLVPGYLPQKINDLIKSLPKNWRLRLFPLDQCINDLVDFLQTANFWQDDLYSLICEFLNKNYKLKLTKKILSDITLPDYLRAHFKIIDGDQIEFRNDLDNYLNIVKQADDLRKILNPVLLELNSQISYCNKKLIDKKLLKNWQNRLEQVLGYQINFEKFIEDFYYFVILHCIAYANLDLNNIDAKQIAQIKLNFVKLATGWINFLENSLIPACSLAIKEFSKFKSLDDIDAYQQFKWLFRPDFLLDTPGKWLARYHLYCASFVSQFNNSKPVVQNFITALSNKSNITEYLSGEPNYWFANDNAKLKYQIKWLLEEFRISIFAQQNKTIQPVSEKRILKIYSQII